MMDKKIKFFITVLPLLTLPVLSTWANDDDGADTFTCSDSTNVMDCIEKTKSASEIAAATTVIPVAIQQLSPVGPFSLGVRYDTVLGWIPEISYLQIFYNNGVNLQLDYGSNEKRANITLGHAFANQQFKFTYEYLAQNLPFTFDSGSINQWVNQNAFGAAYRYLLPHQIIHSFDINGYYIHSNNKDLSDVIFYQNNDPYLNQRRIAGGTEETVTAGFSLMPFPALSINLGGGYSHLVYDTQYEDNQDSSTFAYNAGADFLITADTKFSASVVNSAAATDGVIKLSQILPGHFEAAVTGEYSQGQAGQPNSTSVTAVLAYPATPYVLAPDDFLGALKTWIAKPVVHATRVLAIKDQKTTLISINATNPSAQKVMTGEMIQSLSTQSIFNFDPALYDKVTYSLALAPNNNNLTSPQSQLNVDIKPDANSAYSATIYSTGPMPNSAAPNGAQTIYHVIITALGYKNGLSAPVQAQADLELDVNFDKNNEPDWSNTQDKINFDMADTSGAINLSNKITQPTPSQPVRFAFDDPSKYPNWDITQFNGVWFLVRKPDDNGYFDANDISTTPKKITISVQYASDPNTIVVPGQPLDITVNPDAKMSFSWLSHSECQVSNIIANQPVNTQITSLKLYPCTIYKDSLSQVIKVKNDLMSYSISNKNNYPATLAVSSSNADTQLNITGPTSGLNTSYSIGFSVKSKAQGGDAPSATSLSADNVINVGNLLIVTTQIANPQNIYKFKEDPAFITSVVANGLSDEQTYQILSAIPNNPSSTNTMLSPGAITDDASYQAHLNNKTISNYPSAIHSSGGEISLMWWAVDNYPGVASLMITAQPAKNYK
jgi:hypothetical protein